MTQGRFVQKGAASFRVDSAGPPRTFHFLLLPKLTMLAFSSAVEPLRIANQVTGKELYRWYTMTTDGDAVTCSNGIRILPDGGLATLAEGDTCFVCAGVEPHKATNKAAVDWLRRQARFGVRMGGICTGAFALAEAGLIGRQKFTLHWENQPGFKELHSDLEPSRNLYETTDKLLTCGGGSAATDMMLELIESHHGPQLAVIVADMCIHKRSGTRQAPQKSAISVAIGSRNPKLLAAIQLMTETLEDPLPIEDLCDRLGISRRQIERLFKRYVEMSPIRYYHDLRIDRAHALLNETDMSVTEIAMATGFNSTAHMSRQFRAKFGTSPHVFRKGWSRP